jgi:hypothetical protein
LPLLLPPLKLRELRFAELDWEPPDQLFIELPPPPPPPLRLERMEDEPPPPPPPPPPLRPDDA